MFGTYSQYFVCLVSPASYCKTAARPYSSFKTAWSSPSAIFAAPCTWRLPPLPRLAVSSAYRRVGLQSRIPPLLRRSILRYARYSPLIGRITVDCMMCGGPAAATALLPGFGGVEESKSFPRQVRAVGAEDGSGDEYADGPLEP